MSDLIVAGEATTVKKNVPIPEGMDFRFLKKTGIELSQKLSGDIWTDYNEHDPGVTILENLAFAMTELAYKANFEVEEIIFCGAEKPFDLKKFAFYPPEEIFPCSPQNIDDYRRLVIDNLYPLVENAWVVPLETGDYGINMSGLLSLYIQLQKGSEGREDEVVGIVRDLIHSNRNLCEDFQQISVLKPLKLTIKSEISVSQTVVVDTLVGSIMYRLDKVVNPPVRFHSNEDLMEEGKGLDEIYDGTIPVTGYIFPEDLEESSFERFMSFPSPATLIGQIRTFDGVEEVKRLDVGVYLDGDQLPEGLYLVVIAFDDEIQGYYITSNVEDLPNGHKVVENLSEVPVGIYQFKEGEDIPKGYYPSLDVDQILEKSLFAVFVDGLGYDYDLDIVNKTIAVAGAENQQQYQKMVEHPQFISKATKTQIEVERYFSMQYTFPEIYGITHRGLPKRVPPTRKVQALQLKAYLLFFEQVLANYLSQLTHFNKLFALEAEAAQTYFYQLPVAPEMQKVLGSQSDQRAFLATVMDIGREFDPVTDRKNRALNHLMARFGEEFLSDAYNQLNQKATNFDREEFGNALIEAKVRFLKNIVELTRDRGKGFNYSMDTKSSEAEWNVPTLKKRVSLLFNISDHGHYSLSGVVKNDSSIQLSNRTTRKKEDKEGRPAFNFTSKDRDVLSEVLFHGLTRENFTVQPAQGKPGIYEVFFHRSGESPSRTRNAPVYSGKSREDCERSISILIQKIREMNDATEGFHIVEHILLRPVGEAMFRAFLTKDGRKLLESQMLPKEGAVENFRKMLLTQASQASSFKVEGDDNVGYRITVRDKAGQLIASKSGFAYAKSAQSEMEQTVEVVQDLRAGKGRVDIRLEEVIPSGALLSDDFYSFAFSVVLPAWPARFRNEKFRLLFEQVVKQNSPAHLSVKCFWADVEEMTAFESIYGKWLEEKSKIVPNQPRLDQLSYGLIALIKYFENPYDDRLGQEMNQFAGIMHEL